MKLKFINNKRSKRKKILALIKADDSLPKINILKAISEPGLDSMSDDQQPNQVANMLSEKLVLVHPPMHHFFGPVFKRFFVPNARARYPISSKRDGDEKGNIQPGLEADIWM